MTSFRYRRRAVALRQPVLKPIPISYPQTLRVPLGQFAGGKPVRDAGRTTSRHPSDSEVHAELPQANAITAEAAIEGARLVWRTSGGAPRVLRRWADLTDADGVHVAPLEAVCATRPLCDAAGRDAPFTSEAPRSFAQCAGKPRSDIVSTRYDNLGMPMAEPYGVFGAPDIDAGAINCYAGQVCVAGWRVIVQRLIAQALTERIAARCAALPSGAIWYGIATLKPIVSTVRAVPVFGPCCSKEYTPITALCMKESSSAGWRCRPSMKKGNAWHSQRTTPTVSSPAYTTHSSYAP